MDVYPDDQVLAEDDEERRQGILYGVVFGVFVLLCLGGFHLYDTSRPDMLTDGPAADDRSPGALAARQAMEVTRAFVRGDAEELQTSMGEELRSRWTVEKLAAESGKLPEWVRKGKVRHARTEGDGPWKVHCRITYDPSVSPDGPDDPDDRFYAVVELHRIGSTDKPSDFVVTGLDTTNWSDWMFE